MNFQLNIIDSHTLFDLTFFSYFRVISVGGLSYHWPTSIIPYDDMKWENTQWNPLAAYGQSNLARVLFTREISRRAKLNGDKITSYVVHPGIVATGFNQRLKVNYRSFRRFKDIFFHLAQKIFSFDLFLQFLGQ